MFDWSIRDYIFIYLTWVEVGGVWSVSDYILSNLTWVEVGGGACHEAPHVHSLRGSLLHLLQLHLLDLETVVQHYASHVRFFLQLKLNDWVKQRESENISTYHTTNAFSSLVYIISCCKKCYYLKFWFMDNIFFFA